MEENQNETAVFTNSHLTDAQLCLFYGGQMNSKDTASLLSHTVQCDFCAIRLANGFSPQYQHKAPKNLKEAILLKKDALSPMVQRKERKKKVFFYQLQVSMAIAGALFLLILTTRLSFPSNPVSGGYEAYRLQKEESFQRDFQSFQQEKQREEESYTNRLSLQMNSFSKEIAGKLNRFTSGRTNRK